MNNYSLIREKLYKESNLLLADKPFVFKKLIESPIDFLSWADVEKCINTPEFYNFDIIDKETNDKIKIPEYKKAWVFNKLVQDKKFISEKVNQGHTLVINNYGFHNRYTNELLNLIESVFYTDAAMHVYCGFEGSKSFNVHEDIPSNFIFQVEGTTFWKIYENRSSAIVASGYRPSIDEVANFKVALEVELNPGDFLYIPSRTYHIARPDTKRLSISIPCWPKFNEPKEYSTDRAYYKIPK
jgi:ribosomal protein L16 Arg81 hydroxylase